MGVLSLFRVPIRWTDVAKRTGSQVIKKSPLGKDPGELVPGQNEAARPTEPAAASGGSLPGLARPAHVRPSELMIGGAALAITLTTIVFQHLRRTRK